MSFTTQNRNSDILKSLLKQKPSPFALLYRPKISGKENIDVITGDVSVVDFLDEIELSQEKQSGGEIVHDKLMLLPYRQISERGFEVTDDGTPLVVMNIHRQEVRKVEEIIASISTHPLEFSDTGFDIDDDAYETIVKNILDEEIGRGKGASFVIKRSFIADISNYSVASALGIFKNLLTQETGAYWTFIVHTGERTLVGSTPEQHVSLDEGIAMMNPISGTYRYPPSGSNLPDIIKFLHNKKEIDELNIVVDEELKMMNRVCDKGVWLDGPKLKEMSRLAHTEYFIHGRSSMGPLEILRETMFAPTVMGGPLESAARVIHKYEPGGRGYYSGVVALIGRKNNKPVLDSGILIRTADINNDGCMKISVGATLVRGSDPAEETAETRAKTSSILSALGIGSGSNGKFSTHPEVVQLLEDRNKSIAEFWLKGQSTVPSSKSILSRKRVLIVDAEDTFTSMIEKQLRSLGCETLVRRFDEPYSFDDNYDLVVMGPGPGDPRDKEHTKIAHLNQSIVDLLARQQPFLCVCLSHQILASILGLNLVRRKDPNQGVQKEINLFGEREKVGFYNTFSARCAHDYVSLPMGRGMAELSRDPLTDEVHAIRGNNFCSIQFHAESLLTIDGVSIFQKILTRLCRTDVKSAMLSNFGYLPLYDDFHESNLLQIDKSAANDTMRTLNL